MADQEQKTEPTEEKPPEEQTPAPGSENTEETKAAAPETVPPPETAPPPAAVPAAEQKIEPVTESGQETIAAPTAGTHILIYTCTRVLIHNYAHI